MKKVMIAFGFVALSLLTACGGSTPEGETKATDSTSVCVACPDSIAVAVDTATVAPADTTK